MYDKCSKEGKPKKKPKQNQKTKKTERVAR